MQRNLRLAMALGFLFMLHGVASAAIPSEFTVQGVLRDNAGKLESQMVMVTISFFDAQTGGNQIGMTHGPTSVMASNGLFTQTVTLTGAEVTALGAAASSFLALQVDTDTFARQKVEPEMYALLCQNATQLGGVDASSYLKTSDANTSYAPATGSANYAPATGSASYAPATGSASYEHTLSGLPCPAGSFVQTVNNATGAATCVAGNVGTVTSIATGTGLTGGPITSTGSIAISIVPAANGGTGAATFAANRNFLRGDGSGVWKSSAIMATDTAPTVTNVGLGAASVSVGANQPNVAICSAACGVNQVAVGGNCGNGAKGGALILVASYHGSGETWCCNYANITGADLGANQTTPVCLSVGQ